jgi:hypothetical protein
MYMHCQALMYLTLAKWQVSSTRTIRSLLEVVRLVAPNRLRKTSILFTIPLSASVTFRLHTTPSSLHDVPPFHDLTVSLPSHAALQKWERGADSEDKSVK